MDEKAKQLKAEVKESEAYLRQLNADISLAEENGAAAIRDMKIEADRLEREKAALMKDLLIIRQEIREAEIAKSSL